MNPFTKFLRQWSPNASLAEFADYWDRLERLVVQVYRQKLTPEAAQAEFDQVWPWLQAHYGEWQEILRPLWMATIAGGQPTQQDPFQLLLDLAQPKAIVGHWTAMQHLPAAREALNQLILQQTSDKNYEG